MHFFENPIDIAQIIQIGSKKRDCMTFIFLNCIYISDCFEILIPMSKSTIFQSFMIAAPFMGMTTTAIVEDQLNRGKLK